MMFEIIVCGLSSKTGTDQKVLTKAMFLTSQCVSLRL